MQARQLSKSGKETFRQAHSTTSPARVRGMESQHGLEGAGKSLD